MSGIYIKVCEWCRRAFLTQSKMQKFCCQQCRNEKNADSISKRNRKRGENRRLKAEIKAQKQKDFEERVRLAKETGVHYGIITAYWHDKEKLKQVIEYEQKIGRAKPMNPEENKLVGWRGWLK